MAGESRVVPSPVAPKFRTFKTLSPLILADPFFEARPWDRADAAFKEAPANPAPTIFRKSLRTVLSVTCYSLRFCGFMKTAWQSFRLDKKTAGPDNKPPALQEV